MVAERPKRQLLSKFMPSWDRQWWWPPVLYYWFYKTVTQIVCQTKGLAPSEHCLSAQMCLTILNSLKAQSSSMLGTHTSQQNLHGSRKHNLQFRDKGILVHILLSTLVSSTITEKMSLFLILANIKCKTDFPNSLILYILGDPLIPFTSNQFF